jgi:hypothetical protein
VKITKDIKQISISSHQQFAILFQTGRKKNSTTLLGQFGEKYFDYYVFNIVDYIAARHTRGLANVHSRKLSATLGGSTSTRP